MLKTTRINAMKKLLFATAAVLLLATFSQSAQKTVTVGTIGTQASLDTNFGNIQDNFSELYGWVGQEVKATSNPAFNSINLASGNVAANNVQVVKQWITGLSYTADVTAVVHGGMIYVCQTTHTAGTFATDLAASKWKLWGSDIYAPSAVSTVRTTAGGGSTTAPPSEAAVGDALASAGASMVYPGAGLAVSTGSAWTTSLTCSNDADVIEWDTTTSKFVCVTPVTYTAGTSISLAGNQISVTGLVIGTNVQAYDADLTTWAGVTPGTGVATALAVNIGSAGAVALYNGALGTPSSLNLSNAVVNSGTSLPGTCTAGQLFLDTDADTNGQLYSCISANTWKDVDDDGGSGGMATTDIDTSSEIAAIVTDETGSGALVFSTSPVFSTSVGIPQGASPTVDAAGEIAIDTTSDQLKYYGGAERVITYKKQIDFAVKTPVDADDFLLLKAQTAITITDIHVIAQGGTSISVDIQECDSAGANCATVDAAITADTDGAEDDGTLSNGTIDAGDWIKVVLGAPSGSVSFLTGSIYYVETAN